MAPKWLLQRCLSRKLAVVVALLLQLTTLVPIDAITYDQFEETYDLGYKPGTKQHIVTLQRMAPDESTGSIYVGSVNRLYKLSSNLSIELVKITGPVEDNQNCRPPPATCTDVRTSTNNINKALVVDTDRHQLITCGSIYQGFCRVSSLDDLRILEEPQHEVVTNTEQGTNVAFIAPGPTGSGNLLYTVASRAEWLRDVPTVAKRVLDSPSEESTFDPIAEKRIPRNTLAETAAGNTFDINYMYGFSSGQFSYFIGTQLEDFRTGNSPLYTKIVRLCQEDSSAGLYSYIELPLVCKDSNGVNYNLAKSAYVTKVGSDLDAAGVQEGEDVLFVTFSSDSLTPLANKSIICMYSVLRTINERFTERVENCANQGTGTTEIDWLGSSTCTMSPGVIDLVNASGANYCHKSEVNTPLGGLKLPIEGRSIYSSNSTITAIAVTPHNEATVVLLGDELGNLKKLRVQSSTEAQLYEELAIISGSPVVQNGLMLDTGKQYVYFMTERKITKVPIETCETRTTCRECLMSSEDASDPHCGWCPLQTSCTRRSENECTGSTDMGLANRWIEQTDRCINVLAVTPANIPNDSIKQLTLTVTSLPKPGNSLAYECVFGNLGSTPIDVTRFSNQSSTIQCSTPAQVPMLQGGNLSVPLSILANETGKLIANTTFDFYNCSAFDSCTECVADYMCVWCIFENRCMGNADSCNTLGINADQMAEVHTNNGSSFCPRIDKATEILIPAGDPKPFSFTLDVSNLPVQSGYECVLRRDTWKEDVVTPAVKINETSINCTARRYNYTMDENVVVADFYIRWNNGRFVLDNPFMLSVTLYKCPVKRTDCGKCLLADPKFRCGWCEQAAVCTMITQCSTGQSEGRRWLSGLNLCPDPKITSFNPKSGHVAGGTRVTIEGFNLGQEFSDIKNVTVAGMHCQMMEPEYRPAARIVCKTMASPGVASGAIAVMIGRDGATTMTISEENFSFVVPDIVSFKPDVGPKSGGSKVTLFGKHLDAGVTRTITVASRPCDVMESTNSSTDVSCTTSNSSQGVIGPVLMTFDMVGSVVSGTNFSYKADPAITALSRTSTILSGGLSLTVMGSGLNVVQEPKMVFHIGTAPRVTRTKRQTNQEITITTMCNATSSTAMTCKSPNLKIPELMSALTFYNSTTPPSFVLAKDSLRFVMDGVLGLKSDSDLVVYVDPVYFMFEEEGNLRQLEYGERKVLEIKGRYITKTYLPGDVTVKVGTENCKALTSKDDNLTCEAPDNTVGKICDVVVHHGNLVVQVGRLEYLPEQFPLPIIIGAACGGVLVILAILFIVCIWRRISKNERRFKKMELQRDEMEMRVAQECKDAFAELQITVLTVSSDVEGSGIPFRDYRGYAARILFPGNPNHPVFREIPVVKENISGIKRDILQKGLVQFGNLISNHTFLSIFIRTLETQKTLSLKDLSNIASLLIIALHNKMDFLTEAMKSLLQEHIKGYVKEGRPQLLLRRSEAVVEKLVSHWVSILMYDSLKDSMGKPLFHLFYAIKQQIDKGPVDVVTGEARYGLSEMKVIRQQIDFKTLNIFTNSLDITSKPIQLKVLDCDTISQTKEKILDAIYKSCPFSTRPTRDELDLEWSDRPQGTGSLILLDDDGRGRLDGEWKRINTLAHYQVPDDATLRLVRAQPNGGSLPNTPARKYGLGTLQTSPSTSASPIIDQERGVIPWHLVKHVDSGSLRKGERDQKMMAEIYLPRLLTTKGILQTFVDELLETIFNCDKYDSDVPLTVKYLFDFLDDQASLQGITNSDVTHAWKSNCLQLRFWVNLIMNPTILFDINKTDTMDACVSIIGQTLIDSCSVSEQYLTKDSPSNKLLYAKDIPTYKQWVARYYKDISEMTSVSDQDMSAMLAAHSNRYQNEFQPLNALNELYFCYACTYKSEILQSLDEDKEAQLQKLGDKLEDIFRLMADSA